MCLCLLAAGLLAAMDKRSARLAGFTLDSTSRQLEGEALLLAGPRAASFSKHLRTLTEEPHQTGTKRNMTLADYVRDRFREYGLSNVHFHDTPALLPRGRAASVELVEPVPMKLKLAEDPYPEDKDSYLYRDPNIVPFHGYALDGDVTADVVYANGGSPEDFGKLDELGQGQPWEAGRRRSRLRERGPCGFRFRL